MKAATRRWKRSRWTLFPWLLCVGGLAAEPPATAGGVRRLIEVEGRRGALQALFSDVEAESALADGIASGDVEWLTVAGELRPASDGAASEVLSTALQDALPRNPDGVLGLVRAGAFGVKVACGMYGSGQVEDQRPRAVILGLVDRRMNAVSGLREPSLRVEKEKCLHELAALRSRLEEALPGE